MLNILQKPYTDKDYADFAVNANQNGQRTEQDDTAVYALYSYEVLINGEIVDISTTPEYIAEQIKKQKQQYFNDYTAKLIEYKRAIETTDLYRDLGKLTPEVAQSQRQLLLDLINQAEELYDTQVGEE